jgi:hypothetical protein
LNYQLKQTLDNIKAQSEGRGTVTGREERWYNVVEGMKDTVNI